MDKYTIVDLETTGHASSNGDRIIEVGIVVVEGDKIVKTFSSLINPEQKIPTFISKLTGIEDKDVEDAPTFLEKAAEVYDLFKDSYLIAHNVPFDLGFLNAELVENGQQMLGNSTIDTVELARILLPQAPSFKLGQLAEYLGITHDDPHRALSDAIVTAKLLLLLKEKLNNLPYEAIQHLLKIEPRLKSDLHSLLRKLEREKALSIQVEPRYTMYRGMAFRTQQDIEKESPEHSISFGDYLDAIYEIDGTLSKQMIGYEKRDGQREMSEVIHDAFTSQKHAIIEAETGTGKSLGYLLPAIYDAVFNKQRIIISTYTTHLQQQLLEEEIPLIEKLVSFPFQTALLKGKHHYLSLEKLQKELENPDLGNYDIALTKAMLIVWITETKTGDIDEIQLPSSGYFFYNKVSTEGEAYIDSKSAWSKHSYYQQAKKQAMQADVVITNHALLCTDIFNDYQFLPTYEKIIIDEAHHLESTASRHYGLKLDYVNMQYTMTELGSTEEDHFIHRIMNNHPALKRENIFKWNDLYEKMKYELDDLFRQIFQYVIDKQKYKKSFSDIGRVQYRFDPAEEGPTKWNVIKEMASRLTFFLRDSIQELAIFDKVIGVEKKSNKSDKEQLKFYMQQLQGYIDKLEQLFLTESSNNVNWIEIEMYGAKNAVYLYSEPTDISNLLSVDFFEVKESVVLTSATLTMRDSFKFIENRLGLDDAEILTKKIDSPFSYADQVQLLVPNDFPDIVHKNLDEFIYSTCEAILSLAEITKGRMLVLFTSFDMLKKSYYLLKDIMDLEEYMLIAQGISSGSRARLKKNFQTFDQAILLGTSSFWEGVDIPGDDLSSLVIVKLPFQPPNHPTYEARAKNLEAAGKNPFFDLSLPNAVIRFKQGFGRLIRSSNDRGIVLVCDARIIKARYGKYFTESIPKVPTTYDSTRNLMELAKKWF